MIELMMKLINNQFRIKKLLMKNKNRNYKDNK